MAVAAPVRTSEIGAVRRFNRFYTRAIGILGDAYPGPGLSLTEGRVIYEMAQAKVTTATALRGLLGLDAGYLSRMLKGFEARGLIERNTAPRDRRSSELRLTQAGRALYRTLDRRSEARIDALIAPLVPGDRARLAGAMHVIESLLEGSPDGPAIRLRPHRPGDMGWVIERHGAIYAQEQGWDERFEALVAENLRRIHRAPRSLARALLDRRARGATRRLRLRGQGRGCARRRCRQAAPPLRRPLGARQRSRPAAGRGVHRLRPAGRLSPHPPLDAAKPSCRTPHLCRLRLSPHP